MWWYVCLNGRMFSWVLAPQDQEGICKVWVQYYKIHLEHPHQETIDPRSCSQISPISPGDRDYRILTSRSLNTARRGAVETRQAARVLLTCSSTVQPRDAITSFRLFCRLAAGPSRKEPVGHLCRGSPCLEPPLAPPLHADPLRARRPFLGLLLMSPSL